MILHKILHFAQRTWHRCTTGSAPTTPPPAEEANERITQVYLPHEVKTRYRITVKSKIPTPTGYYISTPIDRTEDIIPRLLMKHLREAIYEAHQKGYRGQLIAFADAGRGIIPKAIIKHADENRTRTIWNSKTVGLDRPFENAGAYKKDGFYEVTH